VLISGTAEVRAQGTNVRIIIYCVLKGAPNLMCLCTVNKLFCHAEFSSLNFVILLAIQSTQTQHPNSIRSFIIIFYDVLVIHAKIHAFYQVYCEGKASSIAHFSITYLYQLPDDGQIIG
jgi:hypothetical protein